MHVSQILKEFGFTDSQYSNLISCGYKAVASQNFSSEEVKISVKVDTKRTIDKHQQTRLNLKFERIPCSVTQSYFYRICEIELVSYGEVILSTEQLIYVLDTNSSANV